MQHLYHVDQLDDLDALAQSVVNQLNNKRLVLLKGNLGAGKTTFADKMCKVLGIDDQVTSPTFTIINEYNVPGNGKVYHFDLYRISSTQELDAIGFTEYIDSGEVCLIEWPELAYDYIEEDQYIELNFAHSEKGRTISSTLNLLTV